MRLWEILGERADYRSRTLYQMVRSQTSSTGAFARPLRKGWILEITTNPNDTINMYAYASADALAAGKFVDSAEDYERDNLDLLVRNHMCVPYNNRVHESVINELFNKPVPFEMHKVSDDMVVAGFKVGPLKYISYFARGHKAGKEFWDFTFEFAESEDGRNSASDNNTENTGLGGEFVVFATVVNIMRQFVSTYHPNVLKFSGDTGNGRGKLYKVMAAKLQKQIASMGYHLESSDLYGASYFTMTRNDVKETRVVSELFNTPTVSAKFRQRREGLIIAYFDVGRLSYVANFRKLVDAEGPETWDFSFEFISDLSGRQAKSDSGYQNTGLGGEFAVLSSVMQILQQFVTEYAPPRIKFSGDVSNGRGSLYSRMLPKFESKLAALGYHVKTTANAVKVIFLMTRNDVSEAIFSNKPKSSPVDRIAKRALNADDREHADQWMGTGIKRAAARTSDEERITAIRDPRPARTFGKRGA